MQSTAPYDHSSVQMIRLAYRDFLYQRRFSLCFVLALTAMLAPLLILFGLKFGLIDTLARRFIEVPRYREIVGVGSGRFGRAWFETMAAQPEVAFIIPNTRRIAASFSELHNPQNNARLRAVNSKPSSMSWAANFMHVMPVMHAWPTTGPVMFGLPSNAASQGPP